MTCRAWLRVGGLAAALPALVLVAAAPQAPFARDRIDSGFELGALTEQAGAGGDPGPADARRRLRWAVATAIPAGWSELVPVEWSIGAERPLGLSFPNGSTEISPAVLRRPAEVLLSTVAHEMGHQIAISLVPAGDGSPPREFVELLPVKPYLRYDEGWADCVSRVWTGSAEHTSSEPKPCPVEAARYVAMVLTNPANLTEAPTAQAPNLPRAFVPPDAGSREQAAARPGKPDYRPAVSLIAGILVLVWGIRRAKTGR